MRLISASGEKAVRFSEVDIFGVFVSPMAPMLLGAWLITVGLRRLARAAGLHARTWHPALATLSVYVIVLSGVIILVGQR